MTSDPHFGLILALTIRGLAVTSYDEMRRVAGLAEELGWDSVWLCDHFLTLAPEAYVEDAGIARDGAARGRDGTARSMPLSTWICRSGISTTARSKSLRALPMRTCRCAMSMRRCARCKGA